MNVSVDGVRAPAVRAAFVLELAAGLMGERDNGGLVHAEVRLLERDGADRRQVLCSDAALASMERVAAGDALLGIANPASVLGLAVRGLPPFHAPLDLRVVAVMPSPDCMVFAVRPELGVSCVEDIAIARPPLRLSLRSGPSEPVNVVLGHVAAAAGFSWADVEAWGGSLTYDAGVPGRGRRLAALLDGTVDAVFDEGAPMWLDQAIAGGCRILGLDAATLERLEATGYRRAVLRAGEHPGLADDVLTVDYSDWPLYVRGDAPDEVVRRLCRVIERHPDVLPWEGEGPFPLDLAVRGSNPDGLGVPMHDAARRYWAACGLA